MEQEKQEYTQAPFPALRYEAPELTDEEFWAMRIVTLGQLFGANKDMAKA